MYKISDDCRLFAGDAAADGAKTGTEVEDERVQSACLMIVLALVYRPPHQRAGVVESCELVHSLYQFISKNPDCSS